MKLTSTISPPNSNSPRQMGERCSLPRFGGKLGPPVHRGDHWFYWRWGIAQSIQSIWTKY